MCITLERNLCPQSYLPACIFTSLKNEDVVIIEIKVSNLPCKGGKSYVLNFLGKSTLGQEVEISSNLIVEMVLFSHSSSPESAVLSERQG